MIVHQRWHRVFGVASFSSSVWFFPDSRCRFGKCGSYLDRIITKFSARRRSPSLKAAPSCCLSLSRLHSSLAAECWVVSVLMGPSRALFHSRRCRNQCRDFAAFSLFWRIGGLKLGGLKCKAPFFSVLVLNDEDALVTSKPWQWTTCV